MCSQAGIPGLDAYLLRCGDEAAYGLIGGKAKGGSHLWSDQEVDAMLQCLAELAKGDKAIHTRDPFFYISYHALRRQKSNDEVKKLLICVEKHYSAQ